jgi:DUF1707 SHOCT-like domain/Cell wall-active antibiotics response LiaF, C-terminal
MSGPLEVRASDAEREQAVVRLRDATAEGRLTLEEFSERVESAYAAKTNDELQRLVDDLPAVAAATPRSRRRPRRFTVSIFGGTERKGRWRTADTHWVFSVFGGSDLDFREASLDGGEANVFVFDLFGGTDLYVPDGIDIDFDGFALFGGHGEQDRSLARAVWRQGKAEGAAEGGAGGRARTLEGRFGPRPAPPHAAVSL